MGDLGRGHPGLRFTTLWHDVQFGGQLHNFMALECDYNLSLSAHVYCPWTPSYRKTPSKGKVHIE